MFRLYSKGCEYAIRALSQVARRGGRARFTVKEVCRMSGAPELSTRKIFQALVQRGFLRAVPGPGGGYTFTQPPETLTMLRLIEAVDGQGTFNRCIMGLPTCSDRRACPLHARWVKAKRQLLEELAAVTLQDLQEAAHA